MTRWRNFRALIGDRKGAITEAAVRLGKLQGQISHFGGARPIKNIGDDLAMQIEAAWQLAPGTLDLNGSDTEQASGPAIGNVKTASTPFTAQDGVLLAEAEKWVRFEERAGAQQREPVTRAERLIELFNLIRADGGALSPEHAAAIIDHAREVTATHATPTAHPGTSPRRRA